MRAPVVDVATAVRIGISHDDEQMSSTFMRAIECELCGLTIRGHAFPWQRGVVVEI